MFHSLIYFPVISGGTLSTQHTSSMSGTLDIEKVLWRVLLCGHKRVCAGVDKLRKWLSNYVRMWDISAVLPLHSLLFFLLPVLARSLRNESVAAHTNPLLIFVSYRVSFDLSLCFFFPTLHCCFFSVIVCLFKSNFLLTAFSAHAILFDFWFLVF